MKWMKITLLVMALALLALFAYPTVIEYFAEEEIADDSSDQVSIELVVDEVANNGKYVESVPFKIINNSNKDLVYYDGCSVTFPEPYSYKNGEISEKMVGYVLGLNRCSALPEEFIVTAGAESDTEYWGQTNYVNAVVPKGEYVIAAGYELGDEGEYGIAYSSPIVVSRENWSSEEIQEVCDGEPYGSPGRYRCYSNDLVETYKE